jgi:hypothetical protein
MGVELLTERHKDQIAGVLSCYDRIIIQPRQGYLWVISGVQLEC